MSDLGLSGLIVTRDPAANNLTKIIKRMDQARKRINAMMEEWTHRLIIPHPDVCLWTYRWPRFRWKFMVKHGAKWGHFCIQVAWLGASIRWKA
ncbi:MAG: hypothetical protein ACYSWU_00910 [Planctomycetota bacterium]|jgi:hypothetical protein